MVSEHQKRTLFLFSLLILANFSYGFFLFFIHLHSTKHTQLTFSTFSCFSWLSHNLRSYSALAMATTALDVLSAPSALELSPSPLHTTDSPPTLGHQSQDLVPSSNHPMVTRSKTGYLKPMSFADYQLHHTTHSKKELVSYSKAALDPWWREAMQLEYDALISNGTWTLCSRPLHHNII